MFVPLPVIHCKAVPVSSSDKKEFYNCPVYRTAKRGDTFVFNAKLKTSPKHPPDKWVLAGVALIMESDAL
jgi:dynein heavy chain